MQSSNKKHSINNAGLDFVIVATNSLDLLNDPFTKNHFNNVMVNFTEVFTNSEGKADKAIKITAFRLEKDRRAKQNMDKVQEILAKVKRWLDSAKKNYSVNTFGDFADFSSIRLIHNSEDLS